MIGGVFVIRYDKHKRKDGIKTQVRVVEGYRVDGKIKQKTIKDFGYLEDQANQDEFIASVKKFDEDYRKNKLLLKRILGRDFLKMIIQLNITTVINFCQLFTILLSLRNSLTRSISKAIMI